MKLNLVDKKNGKLRFEITGSGIGYVNSLRRYFSSEVPVMAIQTLEIKQNTSALYDEILAHRLGLVPLKTDLKSYNVAAEGAEESAATHVKLTLKVAGPKTVYASDLKSDDSNIVPVEPDIPIVKLIENQELELVATATLGFGKNHVKWSPGLMSYYYKPIIKINNNSPKLKECLELVPPQIVKKGQIDESKIDAPEIIDAIKDVCPEVISIEYKKPQEDFIFTVESWGQLSPKDIVEEGLNQYDAQLDEFAKLLKEI